MVDNNIVPEEEKPTSVRKLVSILLEDIEQVLLDDTVGFAENVLLRDFPSMVYFADVPAQDAPPLDGMQPEMPTPFERRLVLRIKPFTHAHDSREWFMPKPEIGYLVMRYNPKAAVLQITSSVMMGSDAPFQCYNFHVRREEIVVLPEADKHLNRYGALSDAMFAGMTVAQAEDYLPDNAMSAKFRTLAAQMLLAMNKGDEEKIGPLEDELLEFFRKRRAPQALGKVALLHDGDDEGASLPPPDGEAPIAHASVTVYDDEEGEASHGHDPDDEVRTGRLME